MKRLHKQACILASLLLILAQLTGCAGNSNAKRYGSVCSVYINNMPQEFTQLHDRLRKSVDITVQIRNLSSNKKSHINLTEKNGFRQDVELIPGIYDIYYAVAWDSGLVSIDKESISASFNLTPHYRTEVPISIANTEELVEMIKNNQPGEEIMKLDSYSRKVQYADQIVDLNKIQTLMTFPESTDILSPAETKDIGSTSHKGVVLLLQNQTNLRIPASEATVTGARFININTVFPGGISVGSGIPEITHTKPCSRFRS